MHFQNVMLVFNLNRPSLAAAKNKKSLIIEVGIFYMVEGRGPEAQYRYSCPLQQATENNYASAYTVVAVTGV